MRGSELLQQKLHPHASSATNIKHAEAFDRSAQFSQEWTFVKPLHKSSCAVVHQ
jgi:hypothetical protein